MKIFKFGGASVKDSKAIRNTVSIIHSYKDESLLIVISAMGKTTNALERVVASHQSGKGYVSELSIVKKYHADIIRELFPANHRVIEKIEEVWVSLEMELNNAYSYDQLYDQVVSKGELVSSLILCEFLNTQDISTTWLDARHYITTDNTFREGKINWEKTGELINTLDKNARYITQGFIGATSDGFTTTLGREGSDFSAAIFAFALGASSVTIWKDVPGIMNADPKRLPAAVVFNELPYKEAAEMTYFGASVIHPKTIKPLANKGIPLFVKCFDDPSLPGTIIHECTVESLPPMVVFKDQQCLISCKVLDYTFINEQQLTLIFHALAELDIRINVMQNSAISFSFCIDYREQKVESLIEKLKDHFEVYYNTGLTLITVKNYDEEAFHTYRKTTGVLLEQSSRSTLQVLVKSL